MNKETAKQQIKKLVDMYNSSKNNFKESNEADIRVKLIDRLFYSLGWDVLGIKISNEVTREENVRGKESKKKKADYTFRLNGIPKIVVEAKAIKNIDLTSDEFREQVIGYAYNLACSWAVLTNFIRTIIYFVDREDRYSFYEIKDITDESKFSENFEILWFLSKESVSEGLLEREAQKRGIKPEKEKVGKQLYEDLKKWREILSNEIRSKYKDYEKYVIEEIVQRIIDRLIFIRKVEDMELEERRLEMLVRRFNEGTTYKQLKIIFKTYRSKYNSGLFGDKEEHECDRIDIDDRVIEKVINGMYTPSGRKIEYNFAVIDADVLGNIYEQYLAYILEETPKKTKLEGGRNHRKEQGIYYTPTYIVNYIVENTVYESLKDKNIDEILSSRILDPACGSGSFLIRAFSSICNIVEDKMKKGERSKKSATLKNYSGRLTMPQKITILLSCIYGVDLDKKAVEIAQLNLLLKLLEGETAETISQIKDLRKILPILSSNIKCGNSLIDDEKIAGDKAFKWQEQFKEIMQEGGFDVVIGNPPYGAELNEKERDFISKKFKFSKSYKNTALIFIEKSLNILKQNGYFGMIVPKSIAFSQLWKPCRELIKEHLVKVVDVSKAFEDVLLEQVIIILDKAVKTKSYILQDIMSGESITIDKRFIDSTDSIILHGEKKDFEIFRKMIKSSRYLFEITKTSRGLPFQKYLVKEKTKYPVIKGKTISRYNFKFSDEYLPEKIIEQNKNKAKFLQQPKIISQRIVAHVTKPKDHIIIMSALDKNGLITVDTVENTIITDKNYTLEFLLCLLNSKLISWYAYRYIFSKAIRTMDLDEYYLGKIPLPDVKVDNEIFIKLTDKMLFLNKRLNEIGDKKTDERARIEEEIKKTDAEIDELVYKIYGITEEEKKIIEESLE